MIDQEKYIHIYIYYIYMNTRNLKWKRKRNTIHGNCDDTVAYRVYAWVGNHSSYNRVIANIPL